MILAIDEATVKSNIKEDSTSQGLKHFGCVAPSVVQPTTCQSSPKWACKLREIKGSLHLIACLQALWEVDFFFFFFDKKLDFS